MTSLRRLLENTLCSPQCAFSDWSLRRKIWETVGCAALAGALTGYALGVNLWFYLATAAVASIVGLPAAAQHRTLRGALLRTTIGGFIWAATVLAVFLSTGREATSRLPDPLGWYLLLATLPATAAGWAVWTLARRLRARAQNPAHHHAQNPGQHHAQRPPRTARPHLPAAPLPALAGEALRG